MHSLSPGMLIFSVVVTLLPIHPKFVVCSLSEIEKQIN